MELRHFRYFVAVADELSFRRAAANLHLAQPSLSSQIQQLEEELRVRLLERDTHHVILTAAGRSFLDDCRRVLRDVDDHVRSAQMISQGHAGQISIGFVASLGLGLLPSILRTYRRSFPGVDVSLREMDTSEQIKFLQEHRLDLGFVGLGLPANEETDLEVTTVALERLFAVLPGEHPLAKRARKSGKAISLSALANEPFLLAERATAPVYNPWLMVICREAGFQPQVRQETGQPIAVMNYVAAGLGVTILPEQFRQLRIVGVSFVPLANPVPRYRYSAAWSRKNKHPGVPRIVAIAQQIARQRAGKKN